MRSRPAVGSMTQATRCFARLALLALAAVSLAPRGAAAQPNVAPAPVFSTFFGDVGDEVGFAVATDPSGYVYVAGRTSSTSFPTTPGAADSSFNGVIDGFVAKLTPDGSALVYSTFLGGVFQDEPTGIAVDASGHVYVVGSTASEDFPTTDGAFDSTLGGDFDAFVVKLSPDGSALEYSTFLGGSAADFGASGVAVDPRGYAYVTGHTGSSDFPTTPGAFDTTLAGISEDAFVAKVISDGSALAYSTFLGGGSFDFGTSIAINPIGNAYVVGATDSPDFPTTTGAFDTTFDGLFDAFVTKVSRDGSVLVQSTFLGGTGSDLGEAIAVDPSGHAYVTGATFAPDFPTTTDAFDTTFGGGEDAFVTKMSSDNSTLVYSTFLGGSFDDAARGIAVDGAGRAAVTGRTQSGEFPTTADAFDTTLDFIDAFVTTLSRDGSTVAYSSFLGGGAFDDGFAIALDQAGQVSLTGGTPSSDFPTTDTALDTTYSGGFSDAFITKLDTR
jgi:Beta-propeller repeat